MKDIDQLLSFAADRIRDRKLLAKGYQVIRYSGTEIYNNPAGVTADLAEYLWNLAEDVHAN